MKQHENCGCCRFFRSPWCKRYPSNELKTQTDWCGEFRRGYDTVAVTNDKPKAPVLLFERKDSSSEDARALAVAN
jgi:hypothetical protein